MAKIVSGTTSLKKYIHDKNIDLLGNNIDFESKFISKIPTHYLDKINWNNEQDPLIMMSLPDMRERDVQDYEMTDPIGDEANLAEKNLVHRYPDRVLLLVTHACQINCRFCFRREVGVHTSAPDLEKVAKYLGNHPEVREIILSGGDPLNMSARYLGKVFALLSPLPHLKMWRIHTRIPVVNPMSVTQDYLALFRQICEFKQLTIVLHINHIQELSSETISLVKELHKLGVTVLSQTVLLKGVNDEVEALTNLFSGIMAAGIKPYYLHHPDLVKGTHHFRVSIQAGLKIYRQLQGNLSGICVPRYVLDLPGGKGKVDVSSLKEVETGKYEAINFKGESVIYVDPIAISSQSEQRS